MPQEKNIKLKCKKVWKTIKQQLSERDDKTTEVELLHLIESVFPSRKHRT